MKKIIVVLSALVLLMLSASTTSAQITVFEDTFEAGNLDQWTGKLGPEHHGQIVADPLNPQNHVLTFTGVNAAALQASATDPLTGQSAPVTVVSRLGSTAVLQLDLTDYPRLLVLSDG